ncbi:LysR family transcriptional regulator [Pseudomonas synxantha]|uniref:LysR family transcriptional regulator n=1 Tax=Pseudomonas TaxID=286 RepID=UPI000702B32C|nr:MULTISPECIES: LysR family transcriptional regulator [Pseudomonas]AMS21431.1 LysR family transcriptional regulator [Pseudomonas synxantha]KRA21494.1 LysR family transcriptional regulator [Pseudomonas sp. Root569]MDT3232773.1 LysR family transcriptional regulator [Pseudomonas sp. rhizo25]WDG44562.1 LysR family transcriptional regulator [Pseudomonas synxantha]
MFDWENMRHLLAVAKAGTLSGAARELRVDHATVGRRIAALEAQLHTPLVERLPRSCRLTAAGVLIVEQALRMESAAFDITRQVKSRQVSLSGRVTLSASPVLATHFIAPRLGDFRQQYPQIQLSISAQAHQVSLSRGEADIAVRHLRPREPSNVARRVAKMDFDLYASRAYAHLCSPAQWAFIAYEKAFADMPQQQWLLQIAGERAVACELSDISGHLVAARSGVGVAGLPCFLADADPQLIRLEHDSAGFSRDIWLVTHRDMKRSALVRTVMDYFAQAFARDLALKPNPLLAKAD